jgi:hypothetical protein
MSKRNFSASLDNVEFSGKYTGLTPGKAATKFISTLQPGLKYKFYLRENTLNSKHKVYKYEGIKKALQTPTIVNIGNNTITYNFKNNVKRIF